MTTRALTGGGCSYCTGLVVPLTTVFTQPSRCPLPIRFQYIHQATDCAPPEFSSVWYEWGYYSPAICPSGYTIGCTLSPPDRAWYGTSTEGDAAYWCVPRYWDCVWGQSGWASITSPTPSREPAIQVRWHSSDLSLLETDPFDGAWRGPFTPPPTSTSRTIPAQTFSGRTGIGDGSATTSSATTESTGSETFQSATLKPSVTATVQPTARSGFSTGAKAGIAVGAIPGVVFVASFLAWLWYRRRSHRHVTDITPEVPHLDSNPISELESKNNRPVGELPAKHDYGADGVVSRGPMLRLSSYQRIQRTGRVEVIRKVAMRQWPSCLRAMRGLVNLAERKDEGWTRIRNADIGVRNV
ncbi:hypothetical protein GE09DRAFT_1127264 [Coniochaeta sp. 2T2.1]|nr:hypothetical protein GE09DRAFT_1127264 [Coniochaeta sp. 2T2.1]